MIAVIIGDTRAGMSYSSIYLIRKILGKKYNWKTNIVFNQNDVMKAIKKELLLTDEVRN